MEWSLDPQKKTYTERKIASFSPGEKTSGEDKPEVRITKSEFKVVKTGEKEKINGFSCEEYIVNWLLGGWGNDDPKKKRPNSAHPKRALFLEIFR